MKKAITLLIIFTLVFTTFLSPIQPLKPVIASRASKPEYSVHRNNQDSDPSQTYPIDEPTETPESGELPSSLYPVFEPDDDVLVIPEGFEGTISAPLYEPPISTEKLIPERARLVVDVEPSIYIEGKPLFLKWYIENFGLLQKNSSLEIKLPPGFVTRSDNTIMPNGFGSVITEPVEAIQTLEIIKEDTDPVDGLLSFELSIKNEGEVVQMVYASVHTKGFAIAGTEEQPIFDMGLPAHQPLVRIGSTDSFIAKELVFHSAIPRTHKLPGISKSGYPLEILSVNPSTGTNVTQFDVPIDLTFHYPVDFVEPERQADLQVFYFNETDHEWYPYETQVNVADKTLTITTDHLSVFDIGVNNWQSNQPPLLESYQVSAFTGAVSFRYPLPVFEGANGLTPNLSLSYNSQVVDEGSAWTQASWVGLGWSLDTGAITRDMHGTDHDLTDDTFMLSMNGLGGRLLPVKKEGGKIYYRLQSESFDKIFFDEGLQTWTLLTKDGLKYVFGGNDQSQARYDSTKACSSQNNNTWSWQLSSIEDRFGNRVAFSYEKEKKSGCQNDVAIYPNEITYGGFSIKFETEPRQDYLKRWEKAESRALFTKKRLKSVVFLVNNQVAKSLHLIYAGSKDEANSAQPSIKWQDNHLTSTLLSIQLSGNDNNTNSLPVVFEYKDKHSYEIKVKNEAGDYVTVVKTVPLHTHLSSINNGMGGVVSFEYKIFSFFDDFNKNVRHARWAFGDTDCNQNGQFPTTTNWKALIGNVNCSGKVLQLSGGSPGVIGEHSLPENLIKPGSQYWLYVRGKSTSNGGTGTFFGIGTKGDNTFHSKLSLGHETDESKDSKKCELPASEYGECQGKITLPGIYDITNAVLFIENTGSFIQELQFIHFVTRFAVIKRTEHDQVTGRTASWTYTYPASGFALNDEEGNLYVPKNTEFRGFSEVTITRDDGLKTVQTYHQSAQLKGRLKSQKTYLANGTLVSESNYSYHVVDLWTQNELTEPKLRDYIDLSVTWARLDSVEQKEFASNQDIVLGTKVEYIYETNIDNLKRDQLANLKSTTNSTYNGSSFVKETMKKVTYEHFVSTDTLFLNTLVNKEELFACEGDSCHKILREKNNTFDSNYQVHQQKTWVQGEATAKQYALVEYAYHPNGMVHQVRTWSDAVGINSNPTGRLFQTTYTYDGIYPTNVSEEKKGLDGDTQLITSTEYHPTLGVPIRVVKPNGGFETAVYDGLGRILWTCFNQQSCTQNDANVSVTYHDEFPWNMQVTKSGIEASSRYYFTGFGAFRSEYLSKAEIDGGERANWQARWIDYTAYGQPFMECNARLCRKTVYDALGRPVTISRVDDEATALEMSYSYYGELLPNGKPAFVTSTTNANGQQHKQYFDVKGQVLLNVPPANTGPSVEFNYDVLGQLLKTRYGDTGSEIAYNPAGLKTSMNDADMGYWTYNYDAMGNLTSQTDAKGQVTTLSYDGLNRLIGKTFSNGDTPITYTYDENGHTGYRTSMTDASGETHWQYDTRGRVVEEAKTILNQGTYTTQWAYDSQDRVKHMFYPNGERVNFSYNKQGDVAGLENNHTKILTNRIMDNYGRIIKQIYGNGTSTTYDYDQWLSGAGRLMTLNTKKRNDEVLQELSYSYDPIGNITQLNNMGETLNFSYDALSRLTGVSGAYEESYSYDAATGNLKSKTGVGGNYHYTSGKPHAVTGYDSEPNAFEYDANGQMVKRHRKDISYDAQGKLISYDGKSHVYDGDGNRVMMDHGDGKVTVYIGNYYERLMERMDDVGPVDPPVTRNGGQEHASYFPVIGNGETVDYETHRGQTYYYAGSSRIAMRTIDGEVIWLYGDHLGSTNVTADRHGDELSRTKYSAWGTTRYTSGVKTTDYGFTGQMKVDDIYFYNARWYDPEIGRFMQADTIVPSHQGTQAFDRYAYVNNNPLKYTDPTGHYACGDIYDYGCMQTKDEINRFGYMRYLSTGEPFEMIVSGSYDFGLGKVEQIDRYQDDVISPGIPLKHPIAWALQLIDLSVRLMEEFKPLPPYVPKDDLYWDIHLHVGKGIFNITKIAFWSPEETIGIREIKFDSLASYHVDSMPIGKVIVGGSGIVIDVDYSPNDVLTMIEFLVTCYGCMTGTYYKDRFTPFENFPTEIIIKPNLRRATYE